MTRYNIVNAPSKFDLCIAFFDKVGGKHGKRRSVTFTVEGPTIPKSRRDIDVIINDLSWEDGSGENWCFKGYALNTVANGYFNTERRRGWIEIK